MDDTLNFALESFRRDQANLMQQEVEEKIQKSRVDLQEKLSEIREQRKADMDVIEKKMAENREHKENLKACVHEVIDTRLNEDIRRVQMQSTNLSFIGDGQNHSISGAITISPDEADREISFLQRSAIETREAIDKVFDDSASLAELSHRIISILNISEKNYVERQEDWSEIKTCSMAREAESMGSTLTQTLAQLAVASKFQAEKEEQMQRDFELKKKSYEDIETSLQRKLHNPRPKLTVGVLPPEGQAVPGTIMLDLRFEKFDENTFRTEFCRILGLQPETVTIVKVEEDTGKIHLLLTGEDDLVKLLNAMDDPDHILHTHFKIKELLVGEFQLDLGIAVMNPKWNKEYGEGKNTYWKGAISDDYNRGGKPYFCPSGWKRFSIKVFPDDAEFERKYSGWHVAYHGTASTNASSILATGLKVGGGCYANGRLVVYLSPSIEYCAHPRYAKPWKTANGKWVQMVLQCRVNPKALSGPPYRETLLTNRAVPIDNNFKNEELEWLVEGRAGVNIPINNLSSQIVCYGIMLRECDDPRTLTSSDWWKFSSCDVDSHFGATTTSAYAPAPRKSCVIS